MSLPHQPGECGEEVEHAELALGVSPVVVLKRERLQLDTANGVIRRCFAYNESLRVKFAGK